MPLGALGTSHMDNPSHQDEIDDNASGPRAGAKVRESYLCIHRIDKADIRECLSRIVAVLIPLLRVDCDR